MSNFEKVLNNPENAEDIKKAIAKALCIDKKTGRAYFNSRPFNCKECGFGGDSPTKCELEELIWLNEKAGEDDEN